MDEQLIIETEKEAKKKKNAVMLSCAIAVCIAVVILIVTVFIPSHKYNAAIALMKEGKYGDAIAAFEAMDGYRDSNIKIEECKIQPFALKWGMSQSEASELFTCAYHKITKEPVNYYYILNRDNNMPIAAYGVTPDWIVYCFDMVDMEKPTYAFSYGDPEDALLGEIWIKYPLSDLEAVTEQLIDIFGPLYNAQTFWGDVPTNTDISLFSYDEYVILVLKYDRYPYEPKEDPPEYLSEEDKQDWNVLEEDLQKIHIEAYSSRERTIPLFVENFEHFMR